MLAEEFFVKQLALERKRAERSGRRFVLMLLDPHELIRGGAREQALARIVSALGHTIRETDIKGWYAESVIGVIFNEIGTPDETDVAKALLSKITAALCRALTIENISEISLFFHIYPEDWEDGARAVRPARARTRSDPALLEAGVTQDRRPGGNEYSPFLN